MEGSGNSGGIITTAVAIDKDKNSQNAVRWALENLLKKKAYVTLLHVQTQSNSSQDSGIGKDGRAPTESEMQQFFLPYRGFCARKGVRANEVVLQDADVSTALVAYVSRNGISNLVVGAPSRTVLTRAFKITLDVPTSLLKSLPDSCNLYMVSKMKGQKIKSSSRPNTPNVSAASMKSTTSSDEMNPWSQTSYKSAGSGISFESSNMSMRRPSDKDELLHASSSIDKSFINRIPSAPQSAASLNSQSQGQTHGRTSLDNRSDFSDFGMPSYQSDLSFESIDSSHLSDAPRLSISSQNLEQEDEMRRLRLELKQTMEMYHSACREATNAKQKASEIKESKSADERKYEEIKAAEAAALAMVEMEKQKGKAAMEAAQMAQRLAELEAQKRRKAETRAKQEAAERKKAMDALTRSDIRYRKYAIEDIEVATDYFATSKKIGEGGYGPVYKASLDHTNVAIKVLRPDISQGQSQFQREVEVLSCMRHPHMVLLLGACPEFGCLVYEYMENGSLEDRLFRKNNSPPIPWSLRFKICAEIATALHFLHQTKPEPLVHRDLKPANILLDRNYVSKISDVGLARLVPAAIADTVTQYHMTAAAGTFCYIDPEYQQTGMLGTKSDIYSFGIMLLQVITAKNAMGLTHQVSRAIERGNLQEILDPAVTDWPLEETMSFAKLALNCCELRKRDRPDLGSVILPELERLRDLGDAYQGTSQYSPAYSGRSSMTQDSNQTNIPGMSTNSISSS